MKKKILFALALICIVAGTSSFESKPCTKIIDKNGKCWGCEVWGSMGVRCWPCDA